MPTDDLEKLLLEAMPGGQEESKETLPGLVARLGGGTQEAAEATPEAEGNPPAQAQGTAAMAPPPLSAAATETVSESVGIQTVTPASPGTQAAEAGPRERAQTSANTASEALWSGVSPILAGVASLFGGGGPATPAPPQRYDAPEPVDFEGAISSTNPNVIYGADYGANGMPRSTEQDPEFGQAPAGAAAGNALSPGMGSGGQSAAGGGSQITIQVQAMDTQSFLDHSDDIARAVKQAILNSNSLNDVLSEL
jgi:hypothetical protein